MLVVQSLLLVMLVFDLMFVFDLCDPYLVPFPADPIPYIDAYSLVAEFLVLASLCLVPYP